MSAFFPFYRNHNVFAAISQEAYRWSSVASATRTVMNIRYSLLTYMYTLFYYAHTEGATVLRALQWEFPNDASLAGVDNQFMLGPSILVTPVLQPNVVTVQGVFPGVAEGTIWYDWYTLQPLDVKPGENITLDAPLEHINVHVRGGSILPMQVPGNTTTTTRENTYELLIALDKNGQASGSLYLDDGYSLSPNETKLVEVSCFAQQTFFRMLAKQGTDSHGPQFSYSAHTLTTTILGTYSATAPLGNVTIAGVQSLPTNMTLHVGGQACETGVIALVQGAGVLYVSGLDTFTQGGAWEGGLQMGFTF